MDQQSNLQNCMHVTKKQTTNIPTDQPTDQQTDRFTYEFACVRLQYKTTNIPTDQWTDTNLNSRMRATKKETTNIPTTEPTFQFPSFCIVTITINCN